MRQTIFRISDELHQQFKIAAYTEGKTMTDVAIDLFKEYIISREHATKLPQSENKNETD